jgi:hypothetical protein
MQKIGNILKNFKPVEDKYISREFQSFGIHLAEELDDYKHRGLYIKLAKTVHRSILEKALTFVVDSNAKNKGALFMWKLKQMKAAKKSVIPNLVRDPMGKKGDAETSSA